MRKLIASLLGDDRGAVVIETAFVVPVLVLMAVGVFESGNMIARQVELQNAAAEASQIALAAPPTDSVTRATLETIIETSTGLDEDQVTVSESYRCGTAEAYVTDATTCAAEYSSFIMINLTDQYVPIWSQIAFGDPIDYNVTRRVQVG